MRTPAEWIEAIVLAINVDSKGISRALEDIIPQIQAEAIAYACRNVPALPQLRVSDKRAAEMARLHEAGTPGEWYAVYYDETVARHPGWSVDCNMPDVLSVATVHHGYGNDGEMEGNAKFIVAARTGIPNLLADRETLLRLLHDSEGIEAYQRGYLAGKRESVTADWIGDSMADMSPEERVELMRSIEENYCRYCGFDQVERKCHCWNDD